MGKKRYIFNPLLEDGFQQIDEGVENIGSFLDAIGIVTNGLMISPTADLTFDVSDVSVYRIGNITSNATPIVGT